MDKEQQVTIHAKAHRLLLDGVDIQTATADKVQAVDLSGRDMINVAAVMVHAGVRNRNGDGFKQADLEWALEEGLIFTADRPGMLDDAHDMIAYGAWTRSFSIRHAGHYAIQTEGAIWAWKYPEFAKMVIQYYQANALSFSMMAGFGFAECSECGETFANTVHPSQYCEHLVNRVENGATRWLRFPNFLTNSRVDTPADADAEGLAIANDGYANVPDTEDVFAAMSADEKLSLYYASATLL